MIEFYFGSLIYFFFVLSLQYIKTFTLSAYCLLSDNMTLLQSLIIFEGIVCKVTCRHLITMVGTQNKSFKISETLNNVTKFGNLSRTLNIFKPKMNNN